MTVIPLSDASRRPVSIPLVTILIIVTNVFAFTLELAGGDAFVLHWAVIPAQVSAGQHWITVLTGMFLHAGWSHWAEPDTSCSTWREEWPPWPRRLQPIRIPRSRT